MTMTMNESSQDPHNTADEEEPEEIGADDISEEELPPEIQAELEKEAAGEDAAKLAAESAEKAEPIDENAPPTYEELESEVAALKDQLLRALAEGQNIRRRTERDKTDMAKYAITGFARQIVSVADNLARALGSVSEEARSSSEELSTLYTGIEMTDKELMNSFEQFNIKIVESIGQKFDHNIHQAMFEVEDLEQPAGMVVQEMQKGYVLHDRLLRPAMVGVTKGGPKLDETADTKATAEPSKDQGANDSSSAYEKQAEAADQEADGGASQLDKEL